MIDLTEDNDRPLSLLCNSTLEPMVLDEQKSELNVSVEILSECISSIKIKTEPKSFDSDDEITILSENISGVSIKTEPLEKTGNFEPIKNIKLEPLSDDTEDTLKEMKKDSIKQRFIDAKSSYIGKRYKSSVELKDIEKDEVKGFLISTSTLAGIFDKKSCNFGVNVIEAPGAKIDQLENIVKTELIACEDQEFVYVASVFGLNDFCQNIPLSIIKEKVVSYKSTLKKINPNIQCTFIQLPLPPKVCFLPDNLFPNYCNRTSEILMFNLFLCSQNDTRDLLSLEKIGIQDPDCFSSETWSFKGHFFCTGRKHLRGYWRPSEPLYSAMHLHDKVRKKFLNEKVLPFFQKYLL